MVLVLVLVLVLLLLLVLWGTIPWGWGGTRNVQHAPIYTHNFIIMYIYIYNIYYFLRWFRLPASNHSFHHEADLTGTLRKRKRNIIEVEHQMFFLLAQPMYIYIYFFFFFGVYYLVHQDGYKRVLFWKGILKTGGNFLLPKKVIPGYSTWGNAPAC